MATILVAVLAATVASTLGQNTNHDISPPEVTFDCSASKPQTIIRTNQTGGFSEHKTWPWMALLGYRNNQSIYWFCGGMLINEQWVLSDAGCIYTVSHAMEHLVVRLGEYDHADDLDGAVHQDFAAANISIHPYYLNIYARHSLVLIKLNSTVSFQKFINPVCLPWGVDSNMNLTGQKGLVVAHWNTSDSFSTAQREREVVVVHDPECHPDYVRNFGHTFCVSILEGEIRSCTKDRGAPLVTVEAGDRYVAAGILGFGFYCEEEQFNAPYNNIRYPLHLAWIKDVAFTTH
ncbi:venom protease-like [Portunus trituberculatus]|uniref:venom protease-like n=1 Tax=Portunus trituberculatus TaxID=210409 RepID=UPI001E1CC74B|nr:venom protease-like [Portunus trituberculatus]